MNTELPPQDPNAVPAATSSSDEVGAQARARTGGVTIQGPVVGISQTPYFHVLANVQGKGRVPIYSSSLKNAHVGDSVTATGFFNSLGNFQASYAAILTVKPTAPPPPADHTSITQFQVFDFNMDASQSTTYAPAVTDVWGAGIGNQGANPHTWLAGNPRLTAVQYFVQPTDHYPISRHNLVWWRAHHPDWIVYDCDERNRPTRTVAYEPSLPQDVPLDIHNPDVIQYQIRTAASFAIARGANAIGADQTLFFDYDGNQRPGWYGCGIYTREGKFVRRWGSTGGGFPNQDPQWDHDVAVWVKTAKHILTTDLELAPHRLKLFVNHPAGHIDDPNERTVLENVDADLDETGFADYGNYASAPQLFKISLDFMRYAQSHGTRILEVAKFSGNLNGDSRNYGLSGRQLSYAIATYLMGNEGRAALFITPGPYGMKYNIPHIATVNSRLGAACGSYMPVGSAYIRKFSGGMVVVNPGTAGATRVPLAHTYEDLVGRRIGGPTLAVAPADAYVLFTASNGCT